METDKKGSIRILSHSTSSVEFTSLTEEENDIVEGALHGHQWITVKDGRIQSQPTYKTLPSPTEDEEMMPFWRRRKEGSPEMQDFLFDPTWLRNDISASIYISHLCGYNYSPENYQYQAEKLESWGFVCMRSRRAQNGMFCEVWYLYGLCSAQGELGDVLSRDKKESVRLKKAISFLCNNASFGSLDITVQRAAMVMD